MRFLTSQRVLSTTVWLDYCDLWGMCWYPSLIWRQVNLAEQGTFFFHKVSLSVSWSCCVEFLRPGEDAAGSAAWRRTVGRTCDSHAGGWSERDNILISSEMFVPLLVWRSSRHLDLDHDLHIKTQQFGKNTHAFISSWFVLCELQWMPERRMIRGWIGSPPALQTAHFSVSRPRPYTVRRSPSWPWWRIELNGNWRSHTKRRHFASSVSTPGERCPSAGRWCSESCRLRHDVFHGGPKPLGAKVRNEKSLLSNFLF